MSMQRTGERHAELEIDLQAAELSRRDQLLRAVAKGSAQLLAAGSLKEELPPALSSIAELVQIGRVLVVQEVRRDDGTLTRVVNWGMAATQLAQVLREGELGRK